MSKTIKEIVGETGQDCSVASTMCVRDVLDVMRARDLPVVAVMDADQVVGVFSARDAIRRLIPDETDLGTTLIGELMSAPPFWISAEERYEVAKAIMVDHDLRQLVVLDRSHGFSGFVTAREILQADLADARDLIGKLNDSYYAPKYDPRQAR